jgi:hypothetical protein
VVHVTLTNPDGLPRLLDLAHTTTGTATGCGGGVCITCKLDADEAAIPIRVQRGSCARGRLTRSIDTLSAQASRPSGSVLLAERTRAATPRASRANMTWAAMVAAVGCVCEA